MMIDTRPDPDESTVAALPSVPTSWDRLELHAWLTVSVLYGSPRPPKAKDIAFEDESHREAHVRALLGLSSDGRREVVDVLGNPLVIDNGMVQKMLGEAYLARTPYLPWALIAPEQAVEIWRKVVVSLTMQIEVVRDYYLVPIQDDPENDGFVVIVENGRLFNLMLFRASYADKTLRRDGVLIYKAYGDGVLCTSGCCVSLAKERRELGIVRGENRRLHLQLRDVRRAHKAANLEIGRLQHVVKTMRPAD